MYLKNLKFIAILVVISQIYFSCNKQEVQPLEEFDDITVNYWLSDGRLTFESLSDLQTYYNELSLKVDNASNPENVFNFFESNYTSLRPITRTKVSYGC